MVSLLLSKPLMPGNIVGLEVAKARNTALTVAAAMNVHGVSNNNGTSGRAVMAAQQRDMDVLVPRPSALQLGVFMDG